MTTKTDWTAGNYETSAEFNRQADNIALVATEILPGLYYFPNHTEIPTADDDALPDADLLNVLEGNLAAIEGCGIPLPAGWGASKTWTAGQPLPDYTDINRWERNALLIDEMAESAAVAWVGNHYGDTNLDLLRGYNL